MTMQERASTTIGACARVWQLADDLHAQTGELPTAGDVAKRFAAEGGNENTARTQYTKWRKERLETAGTRERNSLPRRRLEMAADGRVLVPADMRAVMMTDGAGPLIAEVVDGELRLITPKAAIRKVRRMIAESDWGGGSAVDELIAERRAESLREEAETLLPTNEW